MTAPQIEASTQEERRDFIKSESPCLNNCSLCGLCAVFHNRDAELKAIYIPDMLVAIVALSE